jgi:Uma2 family endonuclease
MSSISHPSVVSRRPVGEMVFFDHVSWDFYEQTVRDLDSQNVRITFDDGKMVLVSPLPIHEKIKKLCGRLIQLATFERDIPISSFGSATWKRKDLAKDPGIGR